MGMLLNIVGMISVIAFIGCILFVIYKLIRCGKKSLKLNYFLSMIICILIFITSVEIGKFYSVYSIETNSLAIFNIFNRSQDNDIQQIMNITGLTEVEANEVVNTLRQCGFDEFYFEKANPDIDTKKTKGYMFFYKDEPINIRLSFDGKVSEIFTDTCIFYQNQKILHLVQEWYIDENEKNEIKTLTKKALNEYVENPSRFYSDIDSWKIKKVIQDRPKKNYEYKITSDKTNMYVIFSLEKELEFIADSKKIQYTKVPEVWKNKQ